MSYQKDRAEFIEIMEREGMALGIAQKVLRAATSLQKYAEWACNGDGPYNPNEITRSCKSCGEHVAGWFIHSGSGLCFDCTVRARALRALPPDFKLFYNGDPRGAVLKIKVPSGRTNDWGQVGICVPTR